MTNTALILGRSIAAQLAACYLKKNLPDLNVVVLGPEDNSLPVVGESTIESSAYLLQQLGLMGYLSKHHVHKIGLTFYFKQDLDDPADRTYGVHEPPAVPPLPSFQLNRFTLVHELERLCRELGVTVVGGKATGYEQLGRARFAVHWVDGAGETTTQECNWLIDATGRARFLGRRLGLTTRSDVQRSAFWLRLEGFDREILRSIHAVKPPQCAYDSYYVTHHFFGRGNWIWLIPLRDGNGQDVLSVGVTWRPDLMGAAVTSVDDLLDHCEREHPMIAELIRSGQVLDTNVYRNYMYECSQVYSPEGWFVIGDAGNTVDPLYSTGLAFVGMQVHHVTEMIRRDRRGELTRSFVSDLERLYGDCFRMVQRNVCEQYEVMHLPYQNHWYVHLLTLANYFMVLPSLLAGFHLDQTGARLMSKLFAGGDGALRSMLLLADRVAEQEGESLRVEDLHDLYDLTVNWDLRRPDAEAVTGYYATFLARMGKFRRMLMRRAGGRAARSQLGNLGVELGVSAVLGTVLRGRVLPSLGAVRRALGTAGHRESRLPPPQPVSAELAEAPALPRAATAARAAGA